MGVRILGRVVALCLATGGALVGGGLAAAPAEAGVPGLTTFYVSGQGDDAATGGRQAPWRTIQKATSAAPAGATILVGSGSYAPFAVTKPGQTVQGQAGADAQVRSGAGQACGTSYSSTPRAPPSRA